MSFIGKILLGQINPCLHRAFPQTLNIYFEGRSLSLVGDLE